MKHPLFRYFILLIFPALFYSCGHKPMNKAIKLETKLEVIAYHPHSVKNTNKYNLNGLTQIIFSFFHLRENKLTVDNETDSLTLTYLTDLKKDHPKLKILIALGGWGGCKPCSEAFSTSEGRSEFARSTLDVLKQYNADGIDLDWEYPAIPGYPGHMYKVEDKTNFTALVKTLRETLGPDYEISFAAGGFPAYLEKSIEWDKVMPLVNRVNIMSYDLVHGYSTVTGNHTPLYSTPQQLASADYAVRFLDSLGVPKEKLIIGAAFYARVWENVDSINNGMYRQGKFKQSFNYNRSGEKLKDYTLYWDDVAKARYGYNKEKRQFVTFDDSLSVALKTQYAKKHGLGGIMFWQLGCDKYENGLLQAIYNEIN